MVCAVDNLICSYPPRTDRSPDPAYLHPGPSNWLSPLAVSLYPSYFKTVLEDHHADCRNSSPNVFSIRIRSIRANIKIGH